MLSRGVPKISILFFWLYSFFLKFLGSEFLWSEILGSEFSGSEFWAFLLLLCLIDATVINGKRHISCSFLAVAYEHCTRRVQV